MNIYIYNINESLDMCYDDNILTSLNRIFFGEYNEVLIQGIIDGTDLKRLFSLRTVVGADRVSWLPVERGLPKLEPSSAWERRRASSVRYALQRARKANVDEQ